MSDDTTARFALPLLHAGQAQKELDHNEALAAIDLLVHATVLAMHVDIPPVDPAQGACWIVGPAPVGAWAGRTGALAGWTQGGWRFVAPREGMTIWVAADGVAARHVDGAWTIGQVRASGVYVEGERVLGSRQSGVSDPAGGAVVDVEARAALAALLAGLRNHGIIAGT